VPDDDAGEAVSISFAAYPLCTALPKEPAATFDVTVTAVTVPPTCVYVAIRFLVLASAPTADSSGTKTRVSPFVQPVPPSTISNVT